MHEKINVLQYVPYFPPHVGGLETHAAEWAKWRVKKGYGTCMVATYAVGQEKNVLSYEIDGYTVVCIPACEIIPTFPCPKFRKKSYWQAHRLLQAYKADVLITRTRFFLSSFFGGLFAKRHGIQRVHIEHGVDYVKMDRRWKEWIGWLYDHTLGRLVFRMSDQVIGISQGCKQFVQQFTSKDIPVIYRGVEFKPGERNEKGEDETIIRFGYVGRLSKLKGVDIILYACRQLLDKGRDDWQFDIVGDGEEKIALEQLALSLGLDDKISFLGYKDKTYLEESFYLRMDICLNASWQEGLPTSVIEALLSKCVVVATDVGGTPEISSENDLLLVSPGDVESLASTIEKALGTYMIFRGRSIETVREKFAWSANIQKYYYYFSNL